MTRRRCSHRRCGKFCSGLVFLHEIHELFRLIGSSPNLELLNQNSSAIVVRLMDSSCTPSFQVGLPPRNFYQSSRGGSVTIFTLIKRRIFSCFRVSREMVTEDPTSPWHHSGMSSQQSSMMKMRRTYNLLMLRSFFCLKQVEERNEARAACSHSHLLRFLVHLLASPSAQRNPRSCAHHPPSSFFPSSNSESHIHDEFGLPREGDAAFGVLAHVQLEHEQPLCLDV